MKRYRLVFLVLGMGAYAACSVRGDGLGAVRVDAAGAGGLSAAGGSTSDGAVVRGTGGALANDAAPAGPDARASDGVAITGETAGADVLEGAGGKSGLDAPTATGGTIGPGGASGVGGVAPLDGGLATGGAGGIVKLAGASPPDLPDDVAPPAMPDVPLEVAADLPHDAVLAQEVAELPDTDARADTRGTRDVREGRDTRDARPVADVDEGPSLTMVWSDEFDGPANSGVDTGNWNYVTWPPGEVNNEKQQYTSSTANVFHDGSGNLVIRARYSPTAATPYTSGRIDTNGKVAVGPGHRIEVRAILPAGLGSFPAIIMLGTTGSWPACGELALMEQRGQDKSLVYSTVYAGDGAGSGSTDNTPFAFPNAIAASSDFHVYSLDWYPDHVVFQVDGQEVLSSSYTNSSPLYKITEYVVLDVALGGDMGGQIDNDAFPMDMILDYVRVYEL